MTLPYLLRLTTSPVKIRLRCERTETIKTTGVDVRPLKSKPISETISLCKYYSLLYAKFQLSDVLAEFAVVFSLFFFLNTPPPRVISHARWSFYFTSLDKLWLSVPPLGIRWFVFLSFWCLSLWSWRTDGRIFEDSLPPSCRLNFREGAWNIALQGPHRRQTGLGIYQGRSPGIGCFGVWGGHLARSWPQDRDPLALGVRRRKQVVVGFRVIIVCDLAI